MTSSPTRTAVLRTVTLQLDDAEAASVRPRPTDPGSLVEALLAAPRRRVWATSEEVTDAADWLRSAAADRNEPTVATALRVDDHQLVAQWQFPSSPLVSVHLDGNPVAFADYVQASASARWYLRWTAEVERARPVPDLPIMALASHLPEEAEEDAGMLAAVLDAALGAAAGELTGRAVEIVGRDA